MGDTTTIASGRKNGYTVLTNTVLKDKRLRLQTKGLFAIMTSFPEGWSYSVAGLCAVTGAGKASVKSCLDELQAAGYLRRTQEHQKNGTFGAAVYVLYDEPPDLPLSENQPTAENAADPPLADYPPTGEPPTDNQPLLNKQVLNKQDIPPYNPPKGNGGGKKKRAGKYALADDAKPILHTYCAGDRELGQAMADMIAQREQLRAINSARAIRGLLADLDRLSGGIRDNKLALLRKAIVSSWKGVYPMRDDELPVPLHRTSPPNRQTAASPHIPMYVRTEVDPVTGKERDVYE